jgi:hypothetical protein
MKYTTDAKTGQAEYTLDKMMHNIKSVKINNKKVDFDVILKIEAPLEDHQMIIDLKGLEIKIIQI